jgi:hemolysin III
MKVKPLLRGHFHQAMFFIALGALIPLMFRCKTNQERTVIVVYAFCSLAMFGISSLYHRVTWDPLQRTNWKKLDHAGIYLMIAGTFTPIAYLALSSEVSKPLLISVWIFAFFGVLQSIFFVNLPKWVSAMLYLIMGYLITPYLPDLSQSIGSLNSRLIISGGLTYSLGAVFYALKRPILYPSIFSYHEIFHICVNLGAIQHFIVVNRLIG